MLSETNDSRKSDEERGLSRVKPMNRPHVISGNENVGGLPTMSVNSPTCSGFDRKEPAESAPALKGHPRIHRSKRFGSTKYRKRMEPSRKPEAKSTDEVKRTSPWGRHGRRQSTGKIAPSDTNGEVGPG